MSVIQQVDRVAFGVGRLYIEPAGAMSPIQLGVVNDVEIDIKVENKSIFGEGSFPALVADGHKTIDITAKNYQLNLAQVATDFGGGTDTVGASVEAVAFDEAGLVGPTSSPTYTLAKAGLVTAGSVALTVYVEGGGSTPYPVAYQILSTGTPVAGQSAVLNASTGVLTFAAADAGLALSVTYAYSSTAGSSLLITNNYQNSSPTYKMRLFKRDRSPIDNSTGILIADFFAVRPGGLKIPFKEGDFNDLDRTYMAYADALGNVIRLTFVNV